MLPFIDMKRIGMRTIKTGIAVFIATLCGYLGIVETPVYTVSVCILSLKNSIRNSLKYSRDKIIGTLLGGLIGYLFSILFKQNIIFSTLGVVFIIHLCNILNFHESSAISSITFIAIVLGSNNNNPLTYSIMRTFDTLVGVIIALVVNYTISRPQYMKNLSKYFFNVYKDILNIITDMIQHKNFSTNYSKLELEFNKLEEYYHLLVDELSYSDHADELNKIHYVFDLCEQLIHHAHGLYLIEKKILAMSTVFNEPMYKYHRICLLKLLSLAEENRD